VSDGVETIKQCELPCCICRQPVRYVCATSPDPEAPDMFQVVTPGAWFGVIGDPVDGTELIFTCSGACRSRLLSQ